MITKREVVKSWVDLAHLRPTSAKNMWMARGTPGSNNFRHVETGRGVK